MVRDIQDIVEEIVNDIDKTIVVVKIEDATLLQTILYVCELKWLRVGSVVTDGLGHTVTVIEVGSNYIIVEKDPLFTWTSLLITIEEPIYYFRGTPMATNEEWLNFAVNEDAKTPFVWLVEPTNETFFTNGQSLERESDLRLYFLDKTLPKRTTKEHHDLVVKHLRAIVDGFLSVIERDKGFGRYDSYSQRVLSWFGTESASGYEAVILDSNLSAIEIRLTLPIRKGAKCLC